MPLLKLQTNAELDSGYEETLKEVSSFVAKFLSKPEKLVMVKLETHCHMAFGGSTQPAMLAELNSIGLPEERTQKLTQELTGFLSKSFGIDGERIFIVFETFERHMWGWNGSTFSG